MQFKVSAVRKSEEEGSFNLAVPHPKAWIDNVLNSFTGITVQLAGMAAVPPNDPFMLAAFASRKNGYHSAAIHIKKAMIVGKGYDGDPALIEWLKTIKTDLGLNAFFQEVATDMETYGYAPIEIREGVPTANGPQWALFRMPAVLTRVVPPDAKNDLRYLQYWYVSRLTGELTSFAPTYFDAFDGPSGDGAGGVFMLRLPSITGNYWYGEPEYISSSDLLSVNVSIMDYAKKIFSQGMMADGLLVGKGTQLSRKRRNDLKQYMTQNMKGVENSHRIGWVQIGEGEDLVWIPMNSTIDKSFSDLRHDNRDEIVASHLVPPRMVGIIAAGGLGGTGEDEGQLKVLKIGLIDPRQELYQAQFRELFRMMGAPAYDTFTFKPIDIGAGVADLKDLSLAVSAGMMRPQAALDTWTTEKSETIGADRAERNATSLIGYLRKLREGLSNG